MDGAMGVRPDWHLSYATEVAANVIFISLAAWAFVYTIRLARRERKRWPLFLLAAGVSLAVIGMSSFQSVLLLTASGSMGLVKLGQPERLSYLSVDANSGWPETTST